MIIAAATFAVKTSTSVAVVWPECACQLLHDANARFLQIAVRDQVHPWLGALFLRPHVYPCNNFAGNSEPVVSGRLIRGSMQRR